jgi:hypothetical protein
MIKVAHLSDTHIGYEAYKTVSASGENQRAVDFAKAFISAVDAIILADPELVIHSGDVADRTQIPIRLMLLIRQQFTRLASIRPDGSRRQLVVVAGNHEIPRNRKEACFLELFKGLPGVHIVSKDYTVVDFTNASLTGGSSPSLSDVLVHALPHEALKSTDFSIVLPLSGKINIFSSHGVAGGSELYVRSLGREFAIPTDVLSRGWDYGALGHWHKQGPVNIVSTGGKRKTKKNQIEVSLANVERDEDGFTPGIDYLDPNEEAQVGRLWYAGSTENSGFGDLRDNGTKRGWLLVHVKKGELPVVERKWVNIRAMFRLPAISCAGKSPDEITNLMLQQLKEANPAGAVVGQMLTDVTPQIWSLVDLPKVRKSATLALNYEVQVRYQGSSLPTSTSQFAFSDLDATLESRAKELFEPSEQSGAFSTAKSILTQLLERKSNTSTLSEPLEGEK